MNFSNLYNRARSGRAIKRVMAEVERCEAYEQELSTLDDASLGQRFQTAASSDVPLQFAAVREAVRRETGLRLYPVQLAGSRILLDGKLAEMRTGEGKTLAIAPAAAVLAKIHGSVHVVTSNSYLARRDANLVRPVLARLGLTVGAIYEGQTVSEKQEAYCCDVTYGVGHEFGFDYLKDNLAKDLSTRVQRGRRAAIVDEIDSVLIDEARVPMIISGQGPDLSEEFEVIDEVVKQLSAGAHFTVNAREKQAMLTEEGYHAVEEGFVHRGIIKVASDLYSPERLAFLNRVHAAVKAYALYRRDRDYVVTDGELILVDLGTGRKMYGRRFEGGLHEALEAKEGLEIRRGTLHKASITYQAYFGAYAHLSGLSGTALTDADEFMDLYGLSTVTVPTNKPPCVEVADDLVFLTKKEKFDAVVQETLTRHQKGQPVLVGCASVRDAEVVSILLSGANVPHQLLSAKNPEKEAEIIAVAGMPGAVTVATNVAGRGTDILLGGPTPEKAAEMSDTEYASLLSAQADRRASVIAAGGLCVLATERSGLRRVDNQLAGRAGRQGDPGFVQFYLSLEDELLRVFGKSRQLSWVARLVSASGGAFGGKAIRSLVEASQKKVEMAGFSARKHVVSFDSVQTQQREAVYDLRNDILENGARDYVRMALLEAVQEDVLQSLDPGMPREEWPLADLKVRLKQKFGVDAPVVKWALREQLTVPDICERITTRCEEAVLSETLDEKLLNERVLGQIDVLWPYHLTELDELQANVSLKGNTGLNPMYQFNKDAFEMFKAFDRHVKRSVAEAVCSSLRGTGLQGESGYSSGPTDLSPTARVRSVEAQRWIGRNEECPCGKGKRYKDCHGKIK